ncbi:MAG: 3-deoxy-manno-octulosonate cytidylyltransferase [Bdellovibrionales bacterium]
MKPRPVILIPARMASTRLPGKPLLDIGGMPMIVQVWRRAMESRIGPVVVACDGEEIAAVIRRAGGTAIITKPDHPTGSDRIWEALRKLESKGKRFDIIINVQGDLPVLDPGAIRAAHSLLRDPAVDIGTLAVAIKNDKDKEVSQIVKAVIELPKGRTKGRALYFSRLPVPAGPGPMYHHIGLYAYRRAALARFVKAKPAQLEKRENLEQLRALALGMTIGVAVIDAVPLGVDTPADLAIARHLLGGKKGRP